MEFRMTTFVTFLPSQSLVLGRAVDVSQRLETPVVKFMTWDLRVVHLDLRLDSRLKARDLGLYSRVDVINLIHKSMNHIASHMQSSYLIGMKAISAWLQNVCLQYLFEHWKLELDLRLFFFKYNFYVKPYVPREPRRDPSNRRLNEHGIYIRHCQESNSWPVPSQAGADTTRPQWRTWCWGLANSSGVRRARQLLRVCGTKSGLKVNILHAWMPACFCDSLEQSQTPIPNLSIFLFALLKSKV